MSAANALSSDQPSKPVPDARAAEPSMEDILASIRRIIADDQSRSLGPTSGFRRSIPAAPAVVPDVPAPAPEPARAPEEVAVPEVPPVSAAERLAAWDAALPASAASHVPADDAHHTADDDLTVIAEIVNAGAAAILQPAPEDEIEAAPAGQAPAPPEPTVLSLQGFEASPEPDPEPDEGGRDAAPAMPELEPLLSAAVGASVGSSLQTLASSVFLQNTASVEAMTREMLRPMLKAWLDDNLPTIVERLVRIEIERVARGVRS